jgi:hypothetical protein
MNDCFVSVSATLTGLGGAAAPVMEEPGLRWLDGEATGVLEGMIQTYSVIGSQV